MVLHMDAPPKNNRQLAAAIGIAWVTTMKSNPMTTSKSSMGEIVKLMPPSHGPSLVITFLELPQIAEVGEFTAFICPQSLVTLRPHLFAFSGEMKVSVALVLIMALVVLPFNTT